MPAPAPLPALRPEHVDILALLVRGYGNAAIGRQLGVPVDTVRSRLRRISVITGCCGRAQLAYAAGRDGWLEPERAATAAELAALRAVVARMRAAQKAGR